MSSSSNSKPLIGVLLGASRQGRLSEVPAHWIHTVASQRQDLQVELLDIGRHPLPFFDVPLHGQGQAAPAPRWGAALERLDGFVVVVPGDDPLHIGRQAAGGTACREKSAFLHKPVGFVGYGRRPGMPNVHALRSLASTLRMAPVSREVHLSLGEVMSVWQMERGFDAYPHLVRAAADMLDELSWWAHALRAARDFPATAAARDWPARSRSLARFFCTSARHLLQRWTDAPHALAGRTAAGAVPGPR